MGFLSRERPNNEIFDDLPAREMGASEKMEQGGREKGRKETLASKDKGRYFAKRHQGVPVATC